MQRLKKSPRLFAAALLLELCALGLLSQFGQLSVPGNAAAFVGCGLVAGVLYLFGVASFESIAAVRRPKVLWTAALLFRLVVFWTAPGETFQQAVRDGRFQLEAGNPYLAIDLQTSADRPSAIDRLKRAVIDPPGAELVFRLFARSDQRVWGYKLLFAAADLLIIFLLLRINTGAGRYRTTAWYAWNPLVVYAFAGGAHFDSVMLLALVAATWALHRSNPLDAQRPAWIWSVLSALFLGVAISLHGLALLLLPVWIAALRRRSIVLFLSLALPAALALLSGHAETVGGPLTVDAQSAQINVAASWLIDKVGVEPAQANLRYNLLLITAAGACAIVHRNNWRRALLWALGAVLILTPILYPWSVIWILPFAGWRRRYAWYVLALTMFISFLAWNAARISDPWPSPFFCWLMVFLPPLVAWRFLERRREGPVNA